MSKYWSQILSVAAIALLLQPQIQVLFADKAFAQLRLSPPDPNRVIPDPIKEELYLLTEEFHLPDAPTYRYFRNPIGVTLDIADNRVNTLRRILERFRAAGDRPNEEAFTLRLIGKVHLYNGQLIEAQTSFQQALAIYREIGDRAGEGTILGLMGSTYSSPLIVQGSDKIAFSEALNNLRIAEVDKPSAGNFLESITSQRSAVQGQGIVIRRASRGQGIILGQGIVIRRASRGQGIIIRQRASRGQSTIIPHSQMIERKEGDGNVSESSPSKIRFRRALSNPTITNPYAVALNLKQQALHIFLEVGDSKNQGVALHDIGTIYESLGQYSQALEFYQKALNIFQDAEDPVNRGIITNNLGEIHRKTGNYSDALDALETALQDFQDTPEYRAATLNNMGLVHQSLGQFELAQLFYQQALQIREDINDFRGQSTTLHNIGFAYDELGEADKALEYYQRSLSVRERKDVDDPIGRANTLNNLGLFYSEAGKHSDALETLKEALTIFRRFGDRPNIGNTLDSLGTAHKNQGDSTTALNYYTQALETLQDVGDRSGVGIVLTNMGDLYEQMGDSQEAIRLYEQAIQESIEPIWSDLRGEDLKVAYADKHVDTYAQLIRLLWNQGRDEAAFNYTERARARIFLNQIARKPTDFLNRANTPNFGREQSLRTEIEDLNNQILSLSRLPLTGSQTSEIARLREALSTKQNEYENLLNRLRRDHLETADLVSVSSAKLADIQALLDRETTLVSYFVMDDRTLAFVITHNSLETVSLPPGRQELEGEIQMLYAYDFAALDNPHPTRLRQLHKWLIEPLEPYLLTPQIEIAPHNLLHYVPFAALSNGEEYLVDRYTLSQLPSASVKRFLEGKRKPKTRTLMALGNPTYDLVFAGREAETISKMYEAPALTGSAATESAVRSRSRQAEIIHLATHGEYNPISPLFSALRLNPDGSNSDGHLYVHEIYGLDLTSTTNLVVLSACQTQVGQLSHGDEIVGLSRAFLYAGTPSVIASLWNIDDEATSVLMERFYRHLQNGENKAEALQLAQQETRAAHPHPYYWAAFTLTGDRN